MNLKTILLSLFLLLSTSVLADNNENCWSYGSDSDLERKDGLYYLPGQDNPFTGTSKCVYSDTGQIRSLSEIKNGNKDGKAFDWYENGQLKYVWNLKDGELEGKWTHWDENGQLKFERNYKDSKLEGRQVSWYENGQLKSEEHYKANKSEGKFSQWDENGRLKSERNYKNGQETGLVSIIKRNRMTATAALLVLILIGIGLRSGMKYMGMWIGIAANAWVVAFAIFNELEPIPLYMLLASLMICCMAHRFRSKPADYRGFLVLLYIVAIIGFCAAMLFCLGAGLGATGGGTQSCS